MNHGANTLAGNHDKYCTGYILDTYFIIFLAEVDDPKYNAKNLKIWLWYEIA